MGAQLDLSYPLPCLQISMLFTLSQAVETEKAMAPHSRTLAWKIPWTGDPGGPQSMGSLTGGHD